MKKIVLFIGIGFLFSCEKENIGSKKNEVLKNENLKNHSKFSTLTDFQFVPKKINNFITDPIRIKLFKDGSASPIDLFTNPTYTKSGITYPCCTETGTAVTLVIAAGATQGTALQNTTLLSPSGKNIAQGDRSQSLSYDANAAVFTVAFAVPLAVMREVSGTTLESAPNV